MATRRADFAGSWYPGRESDCRLAIEEFLRGTVGCPSPEKAKCGGIVPHAGWYYSGKVACNVIRCMQGQIKPDTIVLFGRHLHPGSGNFIMTEGRWATPLGDLIIDGELAGKLAAEFPFKVETATSHEPDNTIELQLPFVKYFFPDAMVLPIGVPPTVASLGIGERVAEISDSLGRRVFVIGSTDLTHYGYNYGYFPKGVGDEAVAWVKNENDKAIVDIMADMDAEGVIREALKNNNACCSGAAATSIAAAKKLGAKTGETLVYTTSYDIRPDDSFVGYVGILFS